MLFNELISQDRTEIEKYNATFSFTFGINQSFYETMISCNVTHFVSERQTVGHLRPIG